MKNGWQAEKRAWRLVGEEGLEAGRRESLDKMNQLIILLSEQNRKDDIIKAANNKEFQEQLFREFHL